MPKPVSASKDPEEEARRDAQRRRASQAAARTPGVHVVTKPRPVRLAVKAAAEAQDAGVLLPCLESLRAALKAYTVCVLSRNEEDHRYRVEGKGKIPVVVGSTGRAITLTTVTTMACFGVLLLAKYQGLGSLGSLLAIGVGACLLTTLLILPALFGIMERKAK